MVNNQKIFADAWKELLTKVANKKQIKTLVKRINNRIIGIEKDCIKVISERTGKIRKIPRSQIEQVWKTMIDEGEYVSKSHKPYVHSQIICAFLALLEDDIHVRYKPLTIEFKKDSKVSTAM